MNKNTSQINKRNNRMKNFKRSLFISILVKFIITVSISFILTFILLILGEKVSRLFVWYGNEPLYPIYSLIANNVFFFFVFALIVEFIVIFIYYWSKPLGYLEEIVKATENIYDSKDEYIQLSTELVEVENKMNQIKINVERNQRIAKEAEQRKNDLIVYLAHDLKTPLTSVIGYLTLLRDEGQISRELQEKYISIALQKSERLENLINEFFEITRFNLSNLSLELSRVNLTRMMEQITFEFQPMFLEKNLKCNLLAEPNIMIKCDVDKIQRVFDNLLRNAINYSFEDDIIEVSVTQNSKETRLKFRNHGNTIPEEKLNRIFEQFYRLDTSRGTKSGGAGLGLAIAKEIVELHHGSITVFSEDEVIEFEVILPIL
ncbi:vancomycin resistance histidine kinase VanS [Wansuia hejianensis]|nr:vancomycin resistance histidine kinase VanS [Wansuia hejianensis]